MFLGVYNKADAGTFSAGSWTNLTNVQNTELYSVARSADATTTSTKFQIDLGSAAAIHCVSLHAHNLSSAATIAVKAGTTAGASDVLNLAAANCYSVTFDTTREFSTHYAIVVATSDSSARYWTVELDDTTNSAGYVDIGRVGLWQGLTSSRGADWGIIYGVQDNASATARSIANDFIYNARTTKRTANFAMSALTDTERDQAHELSRVLGKTGEVLLYPANQIYDMLGVLNQPNALTRKITDINGTEFEVIER